jgi:hypothetical protein
MVGKGDDEQRTPFAQKQHTTRTNDLTRPEEFVMFAQSIAHDDC